MTTQDDAQTVPFQLEGQFTRQGAGIFALGSPNQHLVEEIETSARSKS